MYYLIGFIAVVTLLAFFLGGTTSCFKNFVAFLSVLFGCYIGVWSSGAVLLVLFPYLPAGLYSGALGIIIAAVSILAITVLDIVFLSLFRKFDEVEMPDTVDKILSGLCAAASALVVFGVLMLSVSTTPLADMLSFADRASFAKVGSTLTSCTAEICDSFAGSDTKAGKEQYLARLNASRSAADLINAENDANPENGDAKLKQAVRRLEEQRLTTEQLRKAEEEKKKQEQMNGNKKKRM